MHLTVEETEALTITASNTDDERLRTVLNRILNGRTRYKWTDYITLSHDKMLEQKNSKEIGKLRAYATELMVCDHLNDHMERHGIDGICIHNDELSKHAELLAKHEIILDPNQSGYDLLLVTFDTGVCHKIQVKHRNTSIHLETTRRNSKKNADKNATGHVSYSSNEFDYLIVVKGKFDESVDMERDLIIFPTSAIVNKDKPDVLQTSINKKQEQHYKDRFDDMLGKLMNVSLRE